MTRLSEEIAAEGLRRGFRAFTGHCYEAQADHPYMPWVEIVETAARDTSPAVLREALGDSAPEMARVVPELRRLFPDIPPPVELPPDQQRRFTLTSIREYAIRAARVRPQL